MSELVAFRATELIVALAVFLQSLELLQLREIWSNEGVWRWQILREDFARLPRPLPAIFDVLLAPRGFRRLLMANCAASAVLLIFPLEGAALFLFVTTLLIAARWRGAFNGGSDYMTLQVLLVLAILQFFRERHGVLAAGLSYLAIQAATSYFIGGFVKLKSASWRAGQALPAFMLSSVYGRNSLLQGHRAAGLLASWLLIVFECTFPLALFDVKLCALYLVTAMVFHAANFAIFGLNRFIWAWLAAYPAIVYFSATHV